MPDYVDAYYGPPEWKQRGRVGEGAPDRASRRRPKALAGAARRDPAAGDEMERLRQPLSAAAARRARGPHAHAHGRAPVVRRGVAGALRCRRADAARVAFPGDPRPARQAFSRGWTAARSLRTFRSGFIIPREKLDAVFQAAIKECRERTLEHVKLPAGESFTVEYVTNKSWSGYNWYQGNFRSLIQVNTDLPVYIDRAVDLACHEGYPGHHVYNALLEQHLVRGSRLGRVLGLSAVLAAIAHRRGHRELRHRSRLSRRERIGVRADGALSGCRSRSGSRRRVLPGAGARRPARVCRQRGRPALSQRPDRPRRRPRRGSSGMR